MKLWSEDVPPLDWHPDENTILLAIERELPVDEGARVEQHLGSCWTCSARAEEIRRGILAFVEYREKRYLPSIPAPPSEYQNFPRRLRALETEYASHSILRRMATAIRTRPRPAWLGAAAAGCFALLFWIWPVANPVTVSASGLLMRAEEAQSVPSRPAVGPRKAGAKLIAHQKVRIRSRERTVDRDFEWQVGSPLQPIQWRNGNVLDWNTPLTAEGFSRWRDSLPSRHDDIRQSDGQITLETTEPNGPIRFGRLVVRASDFHPVEEDMRFADSQELQITEIAFDIREVAANVSAHNAPRNPDSPLPATDSGISSKLLPSDAELSNAELAVRYQLFQRKWDIGEDLSISRSGGTVTLTGVVSSEDRTRDMRQAFASAPNVALAIQSPQEAAALRPTDVSSAAIPLTPSQTRSEPVLLPLLEQELPDLGSRRTLINASLAASDSAMSHAWALRRLAERYTRAEIELLSPESRQELLQMVLSHLTELQSRNSELQPLVRILPVSNETKPSVSELPEPWKKTLHSLFQQAEQQDHDVTELLTGSAGVSDATITGFITTHARLATTAAEIATQIAAKGIEIFNH